MTSNGNRYDRLDKARSHFKRADRLDDEGRYEEALNECNLAIQLDLDFADAYNLRGVILENIGLDREAISAYRTAAGLDPDLVQAAENLKELREKSTVRHDLVTIATFNYPLEAEIARGKLESEGISAYVADEYMATMNWLYTTAIGGVKLQVAEPDAQRSLRIIDQNSNHLNAADRRLAGSEDQPQCPRCRSYSARYETFNSKIAFVTHILTLGLFSTAGAGIPIPFLSKKWKCDDCGYSWKWGEPKRDISAREASSYRYKSSRNKIPRSSEYYFYCVKCGKEVDEDEDTCPYCGDSLSDTVENSLPSDYKCPSCEKPVLEQWGQCPHCGEPLFQITGYTCSRCGKDVEENWKECPFCGESLDETEA